MSDIPAETTEQVTFRDILARIDRQMAETRKLQAKSDEFAAEQRKLLAEDRKLNAEADKLARDRGLAPWTLAFAVLAAVLAGLPTVLRLLGQP